LCCCEPCEPYADDLFQAETPEHVVRYPGVQCIARVRFCGALSSILFFVGFVAAQAYMFKLSEHSWGASNVISFALEAACALASAVDLIAIAVHMLRSPATTRGSA
jgi:hypothetical protein